MSESIDEKLRALAKHSKLELPTEFDAHINRLLDYLFITDSKVRRVRSPVWKSAAAIVAFCVLNVSSGVFATNYVVTERLQNMTDKEVREYNQNEQMTGANADSFSRALTEDEQERLRRLRTAYCSEGEFPVSQLLTVISQNDIDSSRACFVIADSLFYFPERELKDEELLEYIDFCAKRDYSIGSSWIEKEESSEALQSYVSKTDASLAVQRGVNLIEKAFGVDVSKYNYSLEMISGNGSYSDCGLIEFKKSNLVSYVASIEMGKENFEIYIADDTTDAAEIRVNEVSYRSNYRFAKSLLEESFDIIESEISSITLIYEKTEENKLAYGTVTYALELSDGTGYLVRYSCESWECVGVKHFNQYSDLEKIIGSQIIVIKKLGNTLCVVPLDVFK